MTTADDGSGSGGPKRHHYVPRSYLERFADSHRRVTVYDRTQERKPFTTSIINAAVISGLYDIVDEDGNKDKIAETTLSELESEAKRVLDSIVSGRWDREALPDEERKNLSLYLAAQFTRTPEHRYQKRVIGDLMLRLQVDLTYQKYGVEGVTNTLRETYQREPTAAEVEAMVAFAENITEHFIYPNDNHFVVGLFEEALEASGYLGHRSWKLLRSHRDKFLTTDRPVTLWRKRSRGNRHYGVGLANAEYIYFPIDPRHVLVIGDPDDPQWTTGTATAAEIKRINDRVAHWSNRYVYHRPNHQVMKAIHLQQEGPVLHINGVPVREGTNVWNTLRQGFIDETTVPVIHFGFGVDLSAR